MELDFKIPSLHFKTGIFKKAWTVFVLISMVFSQTLIFASAQADEYDSSDTPVLTLTYRPSKAVVSSSSSSTPFTWTGVDRAFVSDAANATFSSGNSAVLKLSGPVSVSEVQTENPTVSPAPLETNVAPSSSPEQAEIAAPPELPAVASSAPQTVIETATSSSVSSPETSATTPTAAPEVIAEPSAPLNESVPEPPSASTEVQAYAGDIQSADFLQSGNASEASVPTVESEIVKEPLALAALVPAAEAVDELPGQALPVPVSSSTVPAAALIVALLL